GWGSLLAGLLEISRYDAGVAALEADPTDLRSVIRRVVDACRPLADRAGGELVLQLPAEPVVAEVDPRRVERILRNLVGNAVEHGEGRPVEIRLAGSEHAVAVTARDHGVGLRPGEAALVFTRFWRADPSRNRRTGGTGLGLAISLEDARLHGGWLHPWGRPGLGAQFRLTLPLHPGQQLTRSPLPLVPADSGPADHPGERAGGRAGPDRAPRPAGLSRARAGEEVGACPSAGCGSPPWPGWPPVCCRWPAAPRSRTAPARGWSSSSTPPAPPPSRACCRTPGPGWARPRCRSWTGSSAP